ncbi:hypothetical protein Thermo_00107 [Thermoplasmatales archaeon]|nr:hypothetical protein Thermo_00107 [Thermoplasmatales archaeon]
MPYTKGSKLSFSGADIEIELTCGPDEDRGEDQP